MKALLLVLTAAAAMLTGCGDKNSGKAAPSTNSTAGSTNGGSLITAPVDYLGTVVQAQKNATKTIDVSYLNEAIQQFNVQEGHYPKTLQELTPNYVAKVPTPPFGYKLDYDANSGTVKVVPQ
jgi:hypothetical protein